MCQQNNDKRNPDKTVLTKGTEYHYKSRFATPPRQAFVNATDGGRRFVAAERECKTL